MEAHNEKKSTNLAHKFTINKLIFFTPCVLLLLRVVAGEKCMKSGPVVPSSALLSFLEQVQQSALATFGSSNFDPKHYVDLPLRFNLSETQRAFQRLPSANTLSADRFNGFLNEYFGAVGSDLVSNVPPDFKAEAEGFLPGVVNEEVRKWALEVHSLWKVLSRKVAKSVAERPDEHTLLPLPEGVVIPGSRFREVYYWDSYWIIRVCSPAYFACVFPSGYKCWRDSVAFLAAIDDLFMIGNFSSSIQIDNTTINGFLLIKGFVSIEQISVCEVEK